MSDALRVQARHRVPFLPAAPFREWLDRLVEAERQELDNPSDFRAGPAATLSPEARVATRCGVAPRRFRDYRLSRRGWIREDIVDACCTAEGSIHIGELYPQYWAIAEAGGPREFLGIPSQSTPRHARRRNQCASSL